MRASISSQLFRPLVRRFPWVLSLGSARLTGLLRRSWRPCSTSSLTDLWSHGRPSGHAREQHLAVSVPLLAAYGSRPLRAYTCWRSEMRMLTCRSTKRLVTFCDGLRMRTLLNGSFPLPQLMRPPSTPSGTVTSSCTHLRLRPFVFLNLIRVRIALTLELGLRPGVSRGHSSPTSSATTWKNAFGSPPMVVPSPSLQALLRMLLSCLPWTHGEAFATLLLTVRRPVLASLRLLVRPCRVTWFDLP